MKSIKIDLGDRSYDILVGQGLLSQVGGHITRLINSKKAVIVTHPSINTLYGNTLRASLDQKGIKAITLEVPEGEFCKSIRQTEFLYDRLIENHCSREYSIY